MDGQSVTKAIGSWNGPRACIPNIDARHMGIELEASYQPLEWLRVYGFFTIGNWRWTNDVNFTLFNEQNEKSGNTTPTSRTCMSATRRRRARCWGSVVCRYRD